MIFEDNKNKVIYILDAACPMEKNTRNKFSEKLTKYGQLCFEMRERRNCFKIHVIPVIIGCLGGGAKKLLETIKPVFDDDKFTDNLVSEMIKSVVMDSESIMDSARAGFGQLVDAALILDWCRL